MDLAKSYEFFKPEMLDGRIHIIGVGSVGSTLAENLVRFGITDMTLYDFDTVEPHNIANQMFRETDIGKLKVNAVAEYLKEVNPEVENGLELVTEGWHGQKLAGYVFLCVDSIELRKEIAEACVGSEYIKAMFDFRMRLTDGQHYAADWSDDKMVEAFLASMDFTHEEAQEATPMSACKVVLSVAPTIRIVVACGVNNFINFVKDQKLKKMILCDAFGFSIIAL